MIFPELFLIVPIVEHLEIIKNFYGEIDEGRAPCRDEAAVYNDVLIEEVITVEGILFIKFLKHLGREGCRILGLLKNSGPGEVNGSPAYSAEHCVLGVMHPDGYVQLKDRSKDIIISGGENISSIEVEDVLYKHPAIAACAVVAKPDDKWGETPCAFIELREGMSVTEDEIIEYCRQNLAHYKAPRIVIFADIPKTSTGKIQKYVLRDRAKGI